MHAYMTNRQALQRANVASFTLPGFAQDGFPHLRSASLAKIGGGMRLRGQAGGRPCRWVLSIEAFGKGAVARGYLLWNSFGKHRSENTFPVVPAHAGGLSNSLHLMKSKDDLKGSARARRILEQRT
jgi:hypothetical protein